MADPEKKAKRAPRDPAPRPAEPAEPIYDPADPSAGSDPKGAPLAPGIDLRPPNDRSEGIHRPPKGGSTIESWLAQRLEAFDELPLATDADLDEDEAVTLTHNTPTATDRLERRPVEVRSKSTPPPSSAPPDPEPAGDPARRGEPPADPAGRGEPPPDPARRGEPAETAPDPARGSEPVLRDREPPIRAILAPPGIDPADAELPRDPPPARVVVTPPRSEVRAAPAPTPGVASVALPPSSRSPAPAPARRVAEVDAPLARPLDEDATESGDSEPVFERPSRAWGQTSAVTLETSDLSFELPDPPSSEVTKPSVDSWDLLGESDGRGFAAIDADPEEKTPPGGWPKPTVTPSPAPALGETPATARVTVRPPALATESGGPVGEEKLVEALIADVEAAGGRPAERRGEPRVGGALPWDPPGAARGDTIAPRRKPTAFSRYEGDAGGRGFDEVFSIGEDTRELLSETHRGGDQVPWGEEGPPDRDEGTSWVAPDQLREEPTQQRAVTPPAPELKTALDPGATPVPSPTTAGGVRAEPMFRALDEGPTAVPRSRPAPDDDDESAPTVQSQTPIPAARVEYASMPPTEAPTAHGGEVEPPRSRVVELFWTLVTWLSVGLAIATVLVLLGLVTILLIPLLQL